MILTSLRNISRKDSVAVQDRFAFLVMILLMTLVTRMPALTAMKNVEATELTTTAPMADVEQTHNIQRLKSKEDHDVIFMFCVKANKIVN